MNRYLPAGVAAAAVLALTLAAGADPARDAILKEFAAQAKAADPAFAGFSAERGRAFYVATHTGGKEDTATCTACHGPNPKAGGQTRAGKPIEPMAVSVNPTRYTDPEKVAKWFERNCNSVLGRACTPLEKGDVLIFLAAQ